MHLTRLLSRLCLCAFLGGCATGSLPTGPAGESPQPSAPPARTARAAPLAEFRVAAVGDIMLGGTATPELQKLGYDYPFERVRNILKQAQIVFGNLEGPLTDGGEPIQNKKYIFRSPPDKVAPALARSGFNVVSLANNHSMDYGVQGLEDTRAALEKNGIRPVGAGKNLAEARAPVYMKAGPATVAFLAYSLTFPEEFWAAPDKPGTAFGHEDSVRADVAAARKKADVVIVSFHWGQEGKTELRDYQVQLAHAAIDEGAAAVLGHHPHVVQAVEHYKDGVILYSLGNFTFGSYSKAATRSVIALLTFRDGRVRELRLTPIDVNNVEVVFQPRLLIGPDAAQEVEEIGQLSRERGTALETRDAAAVLTLADRSGT